ncbi:glutaredoxin family protein [Miniphocaeibacter halophilus]|uniref:Glutaredoxin family protein n=1 Tax=Miniphocaeibacter halophilus TaxID=2931922 RepID=A0AC61MW85_9FIRM|nr:glutaredoxin family protein [Miniphocaeibacter halophilus]QQK07983.1 glutaredoxin family protein [Miniphocaeibacter halophilus]
MANVVVYSSDTCPYCVAAKQFLENNKVAFTEKNISKDSSARTELMKMGHMGVPVILVDEQEVVGFDEPKLRNLLGL